MEPLQKDQLFAPKAPNASLWAKLGGEGSGALGGAGVSGDSSRSGLSREERLRRREEERRRRRNPRPAQLEAPSQELAALERQRRPADEGAGTAQLFATGNAKLADLFHDVENGGSGAHKPPPTHSAEEERAEERRRQAYEAKRLRFQEKTRDSIRALSQDARKSSNGDAISKLQTNLQPRAQEKHSDSFSVPGVSNNLGQMKDIRFGEREFHQNSRNNFAPNESQQVHHHHTPNGIEEDPHVQSASKSSSQFGHFSKSSNSSSNMFDGSEEQKRFAIDMSARHTHDTVNQHIRNGERAEYHSHDMHTQPENSNMSSLEQEKKEALDARSRYARELENQMHEKRLREEEDRVLRNQQTQPTSSGYEHNTQDALDARARYAHELEQQIHEKKRHEELDRILRSQPSNTAPLSHAGDAQAALNARAQYAHELEQQIHDKKRREEEERLLRDQPRGIQSAEHARENQRALDARAQYAHELEQQIHDKKRREEEERLLRDQPRGLQTAAHAQQNQSALDARTQYAHDLEQQIRDKKRREEEDRILRSQPQGLTSDAHDQHAQAALNGRARYAHELEQQIREKKLRDEQERLLARGIGHDESRGPSHPQHIEAESAKQQYARDLEKQIRDKKIREQQQRLETRVEEDYSAPSPVAASHAHRGIHQALGWGPGSESAAAQKKSEYARYLEQQMAEKKQRENAERVARRGLDTSRSVGYGNGALPAPQGFPHIVPTFPSPTQQQIPPYQQTIPFDPRHHQQQPWSNTPFPAALQQPQPPLQNSALSGPQQFSGGPLVQHQMYPVQYPPGGAVPGSGQLQAPHYQQPHPAGVPALHEGSQMGNSGGVYYSGPNGASSCMPGMHALESARSQGPGSPSRASVPRFTKLMLDPSDPAVQAELAEKRMKQMAQRNELLSQMQMDQARKEREKKERERQEREDEERLAREQREIQESLEREKEAQKRKIEHQEQLEKQIAEKKRQREEEEEQRKRQEEEEEERVVRERRELELKFKDPRRPSIGAMGAATPGEHLQQGSSSSPRSAHAPMEAAKAGLFDPASPEMPPQGLPGTAQLFEPSVSPRENFIPPDERPISKRSSSLQVRQLTGRLPNSVAAVDANVARRNSSGAGAERGTLSNAHDDTLDTLLRETAATRSEQARTREALEYMREQLEDLRHESSSQEDIFRRNVLGYVPAPQPTGTRRRRSNLRDAGKRQMQPLGKLSSPQDRESWADLGSPALQLVKSLFPSASNSDDTLRGATSPLGQTLESESKFIFPDGKAFGVSRDASRRAHRTSPRKHRASAWTGTGTGTGTGTEAPGTVTDENIGIAVNQKIASSPPPPARLQPSASASSPLQKRQLARKATLRVSPVHDPCQADEPGTKSHNAPRQEQGAADFDIYRIHEQNRERLARLESMGDCSKLHGDQLDAFLEDFLEGKRSGHYHKRPLVPVPSERRLDCETRWLPTSPPSAP